MQFLNVNFKFLHGILSDHNLIQIEFDKDKIWLRGHRFWKFNVELLKDLDYVNLINSEISNIENEDSNIQAKSLLWDFTKCRLRGKTISYAAYMAKQQKAREIDLQEQLAKLEKNLSMTPSFSSLEAYTEVKDELKSICLDKIKGSVIRSRAEFIEYNEKNSKYFSNLEKKNFNMKCSNCLNKQKNLKSYMSKGNFINNYIAITIKRMSLWTL